MNVVPTKPIEGQKTGTSGLRKKTKVFMGEHYLANWCAEPLPCHLLLRSMEKHL